MTFSKSLTTSRWFLLGFWLAPPGCETFKSKQRSNTANLFPFDHEPTHRGFFPTYQLQNGDLGQIQRTLNHILKDVRLHKSFERRKGQEQCFLSRQLGADDSVM